MTPPVFQKKSKGDKDIAIIPAKAVVALARKLN